MNRWRSLCIAVLLTGSLTGCCYRGGQYDPCTGISYGGWWEPCCWTVLDPLYALFCCPSRRCGGSCHARPAGPPAAGGACGCNACGAPGLTPGMPMPAYPSLPEPVPHFAPGPVMHQSAIPDGIPAAPVYYPSAVPAPLPMEVKPMPEEVPPAPAAEQSFHQPRSTGGTYTPTQDARGQRWIPARL